MAEIINPTNKAVEDFRRARWQAALQQAYARMTGRSNDLLSYEDVRRALHATTQIERGLQDIPLEAIIGSVGRYSDFTRSFLPRSDTMRDRWARVSAIATNGSGWPPIQVYKVGEAYFVLDGNHRVSVARQMGLTHIQAYVTEVITKVPLTADVQPDELICKAQYADFLAHTHLDDTRPNADLSVTAPGTYDILEDHIAVHRYYMGNEFQREFSVAEAAASWYDYVYLPVIQAISERGVLRDFPDRTPTDLYIWLSEHRAELEEMLGWEVSTEAAASDLVETQSQKHPLTRMGKRILDTIVPEEFLPGPEPGEWRKERLVQRYLEKLFHDILVPISGQESGWNGLEQALVIAQREGGQLRGLHIVAEEEEKDTPVSHDLQNAFVQRCHEAGVNGSLTLETGPVANTIVDRARWNDLVVINLLHPPGRTVLERLESGFRQVVQRCPRPILAVPQTVTPLNRALLAYDGHAKSKEALFIAAYVAEEWEIPLVVVMAYDKKGPNEAALDHARRYLELHEISAEFVVAQEDAATLVLNTAVSHDCDFIIMGGYGAQPVVEAILGSVASEILTETHLPTLICQ
ncbi:MAG: universal stress protein [Ardenticatenaceae bacterium]|nr:universal stress protein [Anaerolineales bacterium]MCB8920480.1 universal stress protein [Ardenticatenaceae bacterium]MCB8989434.1 universal stress protein [Ardenticatenaceae bacterium]MCB9005028.1 universal stress protein [Ardenticatenaceae bacterium]